MNPIAAVRARIDEELAAPNDWPPDTLGYGFDELRRALLRVLWAMLQPECLAVVFVLWFCILTGAVLYEVMP